MNSQELKAHFERVLINRSNLMRIFEKLESIELEEDRNEDDQSEIEEMQIQLFDEVWRADRNLVMVYKCAIIQDIDVDGSRSLKVYQFFFRNRDQINELLQQINLPKSDQSIWGIIALTAIMFIYATI